MPYYLENTDFIPELAGFGSVLIIPCRFCPAASSAVSRGEPYIELIPRLLKTASYEEFISELRSGLEKQGVRTGVFRSRMVHQFVLCSWTEGRREQLEKVARKYEAILVLGCEAAVRTVEDAIGSAPCRVVPGMKTLGLMSIKPRFALPLSVSLEMDSLTPVVFEQTGHRERSQESRV